MEKELKVKEGLDRMKASYASNKSASNIQILSHDLIEDNRAKIASLRMNIDRIGMDMKRAKQGDLDSDERTVNSTDTIIQDLLYRLYREVALADGALKMMRTLDEKKKVDPKTMKDATETRTQAQEKMNLIRMAVEKYA